MEKRETMILGAAISLLKRRLGIDTIALAGQSRGSIIGGLAAVAAPARREVRGPGVRRPRACKLRSCGAVEVAPSLTRAQISRIAYDPYAHIDSIERDPDRRVFIVGDPQDKISNFQQELEYADAVKAGGHHALAIPVKAKDDMHHDSVRFALRAAAACVNDQGARRGRSPQREALPADRSNERECSEPRLVTGARGHHLPTPLL
jgi:hypothetical protein